MAKKPNREDIAVKKYQNTVVISRLQKIVSEFFEFTKDLEDKEGPIAMAFMKKQEDAWVKFCISKHPIRVNINKALFAQTVDRVILEREKEKNKDNGNRNEQPSGEQQLTNS